LDSIDSSFTSSLDSKSIDNLTSWLKQDIDSKNSSVTKYPNRIFFTEVDSSHDDFSFGSYILSFDLLLIMDEKDLEALESLKTQ
jgi:hypothetical protein